MNVICLLSIFFLCSCVLSSSLSKNLTSRPDAVHVGALFTFDSIIGRVAKIAIEEAVKDINSNFSVLHGTKLKLTMQNTNCSGFLGIVEALQFMGTDIVAIVGPQSSVIAHIISQVASELQVPLLSFAATDPTLSSLQFPFFVRTTQSDLHQMDAIADIVSYYGWREVVAIYSDDQYGRNGVSALDNALAERRCRVPYKAGINPASIGNKTEIMDLLVKVALLESRVIVLHVNPDSGSQVFSVAHYLGMMGNGFVWIATDWLSAFLDSSASVSTDSMQGVLVLRQHTPDSDRKRAVTSQWKKLSGDSIFLNSYGIYAYDTVWLVAYAIDAFFNQGGNISFSSASRLSSAGKGKVQLEAMSIFDGGKLLLKNILKSDFSGLTGRVKFNSDRSLAFPAYDIINVIGTGLRQIGYWSSESGLSTMSPETLDMKLVNHSNSRQRLYSVIWPGETIMTPRGWVFPNNGKQLRIGVPRRVSYKEFVSQIPGTDMFKGFCIDVFVAAVNLLPYAVPYQFIPFGDGHKNPSYNDLVHSITTGVFDAVVGDISIVTNRTRIVDFTQPYATSDLVVVTSFRKMNSGAWAFLRPLSPFMWGVTATFLLAIGIVVWILEHRINDEFRGPPRKQMMTILWFSFSTLFFAHRENTLSTLGRMVLIIWLFVVLVINSSYTASLTSILTVQRLYSSIKGIETLQAGDKPIGYQLGSFAEYFLREELNISKSRLVPLGSPDEFANALHLGPEKGGVAAAVDERPYVDLFLASQCNFRVVGRDLTRSGWGFAFPRDSSLAVDLSTAILTLSENGDLQRIHDKWLTRPTCSLESTDFEPDRLHLKSFWGLFVICGIACLLALLIYFCRIMRKFFRAGPESDLGGGGGSARSRRLRALLSFLDEKKGDSSHGNKRRKIETPSADNYKEDELGRNPKRRQTESDFVDN